VRVIRRERKKVTAVPSDSSRFSSLGDVAVQTTERYLGCKQKLRIAVNDRLGIEADAA